MLVACAVVAALVAFDYRSNAGAIYRGVEVDGVSLGGKTPEEAREVMEERAAGMLREIRFAAASEEYAFGAEELGVDFDVAGAVDRAYAVGREGGILKRLGERAEATA